MYRIVVLLFCSVVCIVFRPNRNIKDALYDNEVYECFRVTLSKAKKSVRSNSAAETKSAVEEFEALLERIHSQANGEEVLDENEGVQMQVGAERGSGEEGEGEGGLDMSQVAVALEEAAQEQHGAPSRSRAASKTVSALKPAATTTAAGAGKGGAKKPAAKGKATKASSSSSRKKKVQSDEEDESEEEEEQNEEEGEEEEEQGGSDVENKAANRNRRSPPTGAGNRTASSGRGKTVTVTASKTTGRRRAVAADEEEEEEFN
jgi:hypothetical protein